MIICAIWEKYTLVSFSKMLKLHSSFRLVQFRTFLKNSLVHVFPKLHTHCAESMLSHQNICDLFTRSHPSKGENRTRNRSECCKC